MKTPKALGLLGQMEAARAAVRSAAPTAADLVVGMLVANARPKPHQLPPEPTWLGVDLAAPEGEGGTP